MNLGESHVHREGNWGSKEIICRFKNYAQNRRIGEIIMHINYTKTEETRANKMHSPLIVECRDLSRNEPRPLSLTTRPGITRYTKTRNSTLECCSKHGESHFS